MVLPDYEFKDLTVAQLRAFAAQLDVDLGEATRKSDIIGKIESEGVTFDMYQALTQGGNEPEDVDEYDNGGFLEPASVVVVNDDEPEPVVVPANDLDPFEEALGEPLDYLDEPEPVVEKEIVIVPVPVEPEEPEYRVVKLVAENRYFEVLGYVFSREHPYVLVTSDDASTLIENYGGAFREASPREVKDFYGG